ncbi:averantin oxidoreductase [Verticillium dahliae VdLs.17]|uniref:Averantin oxidoreductase n=2 Tax=Verticillium dahliae TaxID=27337 RepID=G2X138_VERDV|nr:averantin oxidoreductase [Verticillium dahliae VdLs.17]KAF3344024.1 hypothetical protein VdG2_08082 [Verticillium dahliae VDG2]KAH6704952.1 averantin oxidoreductase [Verticillium dahliae]EGY22529.1 averantin oxidoreductase [Verticillium dahliae VdLs.17]PNH31652.1 hypothetical protein BJF96_g4999 [Verticillium dahliae]PNH56616.1 hypothetical protein VD0003_g1153 [Verticillium dahliae]
MVSLAQFISSTGGVQRNAVPFVFGALAHLFCFRVGDWDLQTTKLLVAFLATQGLLAVYIVKADVDGLATAWQSWKLAAQLSFSFLAGLYASLLTYRAAFHRLNRFPGPFAARLSNFYITRRSVKNFQLFQEVQDLHKQYGDIVRIGPSELSIADPSFFHHIHANSSPFVKGPWYNILHPVVSLQLVRDKKEHSRRRKTWDKGFGSKALHDYEPRVVKYTDQLLSQIKQTEGKPINVSTWFNFYSFDVMGDLAFGRSFNMMKDGIVHYYMQAVHTSMQAVAAFSHLVWIFPLFKEIPGLNHEHLKFQAWLHQHVKQRRENKPEIPDAFSGILNDYETLEKPTKQDMVNLVGDAHLIVVAGSDTTAASLTCLFYNLARNPQVTAQLQADLDAYHAEHAQADHLSLSKLPYLQACIDESLRLYPPVPSGVQRMSPPEGQQVGDVFIPANTVVQVPSYTLNRDARVFARPDEFVPERWTTAPELTKDASVFAPFSVGRYSCVGKQLGLMELRFVTSQILRTYDVGFAKDFDPSTFPAGLQDTFTLATSKLYLVFTRRKEVANP